MKKSIIKYCLLVIVYFTSLLSGQNQKPPEEYFTIGLLQASFGSVNARDAETSLRLYASKILDRMNKKMNRNIKLKTVIYSSFEGLKSAIINKKVDFITTSVDDYIRLDIADKFSPFFAGSMSEKSAPEFLLLYDANQDLRTILSKTNISLAVSTETQLSIGFIWGTVYLNETHKIKFSNISTTDLKKESLAIYNVFFKKNDFCVVSRNAYETLIELNPQIKSKVKLLATSIPLISNSMFIHNDFNKTLSDAMR
jgi:hypothetical protein